MNPSKPGQKLWNEIKGAFVTKGESLPKWCLANGIDHSNLAKNCLGQRNGKKALWWRQQVINFIQESSIMTFDFNSLTNHQLISWATTYAGWHYFYCNDELRCPEGGLARTNNWEDLCQDRRVRIVAEMKERATQEQIDYVLDK